MGFATVGFTSVTWVCCAVVPVGYLGSSVFGYFKNFNLIASYMYSQKTKLVKNSLECNRKKNEKDLSRFFEPSLKVKFSHFTIHLANKIS